MLAAVSALGLGRSSPLSDVLSGHMRNGGLSGGRVRLSLQLSDVCLCCGQRGVLYAGLVGK